MMDWIDIDWIGLRSRVRGAEISVPVRRKQRGMAWHSIALHSQLRCDAVSVYESSGEAKRMGKKRNGKGSSWI